MSDPPENMCVLEELPGGSVFVGDVKWPNAAILENAKEISRNHSKTNPDKIVCAIFGNQVLETFYCLQDAIDYRNNPTTAHVHFHIIALYTPSQA